MTTFSITPVIVGLADRALDVTTGILRSRLNAGAVPDEFEVVQQKVAESAAEVKTANLIFEAHLRASVAALAAGHVIGEQEVADNRLMSSYMVRLSMQAIERLCALSGSRWIYNDHPMQVILRTPWRAPPIAASTGGQRPHLQSKHRRRAAGSPPIGP